MTVNELFGLLVDLRGRGHGSSQVLLSSDAEGNSFSPLIGYFTATGQGDAKYAWIWGVDDEDALPEEIEGHAAVVVLKPMN